MGSNRNVIQGFVLFHIQFSRRMLELLLFYFEITQKHARRYKIWPAAIASPCVIFKQITFACRVIWVSEGGGGCWIWTGSRVMDSVDDAHMVRTKE